MSVEWINSGGGASMVTSSLNKTLIFNVDCCTGCKICELICSMAKHGEYNPKKSHIRILRNWETDVVS